MSKSAAPEPVAPESVAPDPVAAVPGAPPNGPQAGSDVGPQTDTPGSSAGPLVSPKAPKEIGGPPGPEPTRYGDWQYKGRCTDF